MATEKEGAGVKLEDLVNVTIDLKHVKLPVVSSGAVDITAVGFDDPLDAYRRLGADLDSVLVEEVGPAHIKITAQGNSSMGLVEYVTHMLMPVGVSWELDYQLSTPPVDEHEGMIYNEYNDTWSWL